jgi:xylan 1,4-beta-xylosidase
MKHLLIAFIILNSLAPIQTLSGQSPSFQTYMNPVIPGDHPDATLTRVGNDFYTTGSSFNPTPVIYHSTDLVHWEAIAQPVSASWPNYGTAPGGGCWGGHLVYYKGKYWDFFSRANTMYFVKADDPKGPWSQPVSMNNPANLPYGLGYDNSIFIDDNNKWYLVVKNGQPNNGIVELGDDGQPTGVVYNLNWLNPAPAYPYSWAEGPVLWKSYGYYYYSFARDVSGGQKVMRSPTITTNQASWEMLGDFFNLNDPLKSGALFTDPNHSSPAIMLDDSTVWVIHPLYAKDVWKGQGRQGLLNQVYYDTNFKPTADYPVNKPFAAPKLPSSGIPWMVPKSDFFTASILNPEWSFLGYTPGNTYSLTDRPGWLRLSPNSNRPNTVIKNEGEHNYSLITHLEFDAKSISDEAGLRIIRGDETKYVKLYSSINSSNQQVIVFSFESTKYETENTTGKSVWLKLFRANHYISAYFSNNGVEWTQIGRSINVSVMDSYSDFTTWAGTRQGLYVQNSTAYFDLYIYRDAYTPILAGCPANQYGTVQTSTGALDSIHHNDWALYAGVEFGNKEYGKAADSVQIIASGLIGGQAELWLDSISTGTLIGTCTINPTGDWTVLNTNSSKVSRTTGRHDVYLKFNGTPSAKLFQIKWIQFTAKTAPHYISANTTTDSTIAIKLDTTVLGPEIQHGFSITLNNTENDSITQVITNPADSSEVILTLAKRLIYSDRITVSYHGDGIQTKDSMVLVSFTNNTINNLLPDPRPYVIFAGIPVNGDSLILKFNKRMKSPNAFAGLFNISRNSVSNVPVDSVILKTTDSTAFVFMLDSTIFFEDTITLSYSGTEIVSWDEHPLIQFSALPVANFSKGHPPLLLQGYLVCNDSLWNMITLKFDRPLADVSTQMDFFSIEINSQNALISSISGSYDSVQFAFAPPVNYGDDVKISYSGGSISSLNSGLLADFTDYSIANNIPLPSIINNLRRNNKVTIYPVPIHNEMQVVSENGFNEIQIYNLEGKQVFKKQYYTLINSTSLKVNLNKGVYFVEFINQDTSFDLKIQVE